jgi:hypothetical protein
MDKKKLFEGLMLYFKLRYKGDNNILIRYSMVGGQIDYTDTESYTIPHNLLGFLETIIYDNIEKIRNESYSEISDYYSLYLQIDPSSGELRFTSENYQQDESPSEWSGELSESEKEILENTGFSDPFSVDYGGYGDSGEIQKYIVDSEGETRDIPKDIEDILYRVLEDAYGGWEINEGSYGTITIEDYEVHIDHNWKEENLEETPLNLVITKDDM